MPRRFKTRPHEQSAKTKKPKHVFVSRSEFLLHDNVNQTKTLFHGAQTNTRNEGAVIRNALYLFFTRFMFEIAKKVAKKAWKANKHLETVILENCQSKNVYRFQSEDWLKHGTNMFQK